MLNAPSVMFSMFNTLGGPMIAWAPLSEAALLAHQQLSPLPQFMTLPLTNSAGPIFTATPAVRAPLDTSMANTKTTKDKGRSTAGASQRPSRWAREKSRMHVLEQQLEEKRAQAQRAEAQAQTLRARADALEVAVACHEIQMAQLSSSAYRSSEARAQLASKYRRFVHEAAPLLDGLCAFDINAMSNLPAAQRITQMVTDFRKHITGIYVQNPGIQFTMIGDYLEDTGEPKVKKHITAPAGHWEQVALRIGVTREQLDELAASWKLAEEAMAKTQQEAQEVSAQLGRVMDTSCNLMDLSKSLSTVTFKQAMNYFSFSYAVFGKIFTPVQVARAMVYGYPFFVDTRQMVASLLEEHQRLAVDSSPGSASETFTGDARKSGSS